MVRLRSPAPFRKFQYNIYGGIPERPKGADCKSVVSDFAGPNPASPTKNPKAYAFGFFICVRRTQHRLTAGQHHFEQSENFIVRRTQHRLTAGQHHFERSENFIVRRRTQMNEVVLRTNDVDLRPMMLQSANEVAFGKRNRAVRLYADYSNLRIQLHLLFIFPSQKFF